MAPSTHGAAGVPADVECSAPAANDVQEMQNTDRGLVGDTKSTLVPCASSPPRHPTLHKSWESGRAACPACCQHPSRAPKAGCLFLASTLHAGSSSLAFLLPFSSSPCAGCTCQLCLLSPRRLLPRALSRACSLSQHPSLPGQQKAGWSCQSVCSMAGACQGSDAHPEQDRSSTDAMLCPWPARPLLTL